MGGAYDKGKQWEILPNQNCLIDLLKYDNLQKHWTNSREHEKWFHSAIDETIFLQIYLSSVLIQALPLIRVLVDSLCSILFD